MQKKTKALIAAAFAAGLMQSGFTQSGLMGNVSGAEINWPDIPEWKKIENLKRQQSQRRLRRRGIV